MRKKAYNAQGQIHEQYIHTHKHTHIYTGTLETRTRNSLCVLPSAAFACRFKWHIGNSVVPLSNIMKDNEDGSHIKAQSFAAAAAAAAVPAALSGAYEWQAYSIT